MLNKYKIQMRGIKMLTKYIFRGLCTAAIIGTAIGGGSFAWAEEKPATAPASEPVKVEQSCLIAPAKLGDKDVQDFVAAPAKLLTDNPAGGLPMANRVRELAGSSSRAFDQIIGMAKSANDGQKSAIAAGLARIVSACGTVNPDYASLIQNAVAGLGDPVLIAAFAQAANDIKVAAVGAPGASSFAGGGATGLVGAGQTSGTNGYKYADGTGVDSGSGNYDVGSPNAVTDGTTVNTTVLSPTTTNGG